MPQEFECKRNTKEGLEEIVIARRQSAVIDLDQIRKDPKFLHGSKSEFMQHLQQNELVQKNAVEISETVKRTVRGAPETFAIGGDSNRDGEERSELERLTGQIYRDTERQHGGILFSIMVSSSSKDLLFPNEFTMVGEIGVHGVDIGENALSYWLDPNYRRRGFVSACIKKLVGTCFGEGREEKLPNFPYLTLWSYTDNRASIGLAKNLQDDFNVDEYSKDIYKGCRGS